MSTNNRQIVDTRSLVTTGLTASTTLANHLLGVGAATLALRSAGNANRVEAIMERLNDIADQLRDLHA